MLSEVQLSKFLDKIQIPPNVQTGCWEWKGYIARTGYGTFPYNKKPEYVHKIIHMLFGKAVLDGQFLVHTCTSRSCCNPSHIQTSSSKPRFQQKKGTCSQAGLKVHSINESGFGCKCTELKSE